MNAVAPRRQNNVPAAQPIDSFFRNWPSLVETDGRPAFGISIEEKEQEVVVHLDAPGFDAKDFDIQFSDNNLKIEAEHTPAEDLKLPFGHRKLTRLIQLPVDIDHKKVDAAYRSGVLTVKLTKAEKSQWKKVEVK